MIIIAYLCVLLIFGILMIKYLEGDFTIREIEVIEKSNKVVYKTIHY